MMLVLFVIGLIDNYLSLIQTFTRKYNYSIFLTEADLESLSNIGDIIFEEDYEEVEEKLGDINNESDVAVYVQTSRGKLCLELNGYRYRKAYKTKSGIRWNCSTHKNCPAFLYCDNDNVIIMCNEGHFHEPGNKPAVPEDGDESSAVVLTSRKGKEILLYHQYTYRKQYSTPRRNRWVCSTSKNCKANVFTNVDNFIVSFYENHNHPPPKYYTKPGNVLDALREPIILETD